MDSASTSARLSSVGGVLTIALFTTLTALALTNCPLPWSAGLLLAAIYMLVIAMRSKRKATAVLTANAAAVVVAIALFEGYLGIQQRQGDGTRMEGTVDDGTQPDDRLGYAPLKNSHLTARKFYGDTVLYDVVYSIGPDGLRIAPPSDREPIECIVFFGDSISFGEGVQDDGTFPYQLGRKAAGRYAIYNFAYSGYGPHQMLANLHAGRVDELVRCEPTNFIYLAILEHIPRVAGLAAWDRHGPRFRLNSTGSVSRDGHFDDPPRLFGQDLSR